MSACVLLVALGGCGSDEDQAGANSGREREAAVVTVELVVGETFRDQVVGIGTLKARQVVEIKPELDGIIEQIHFREGQRCQSGDMLFSIESSKIESELRATKAALEQARTRMGYAEKTFERFQGLVEAGAATEDRLDQTQTEYLSAQAEVNRLGAQVELIEERLSETQIRAPLAGVLGDRMVDVGDFVKTGQHLVTLYTAEELEIAYKVPERYMGRVELGQETVVTVGAYPGREFVGEVSYVSPSVDETTRKFLVKADIDNREGLLKPGAFATALLTVDVLEDEPAVPEEVLVATAEGYVAFVVEEGVAYERAVEVGLRKTGTAQVVSGLERGEMVVTKGHQNLSDEAQVQVSSEGEGAAGEQDEDDASEVPVEE